MCEGRTAIVVYLLLALIGVGVALTTLPGCSGCDFCLGTLCSSTGDPQPAPGSDSDADTDDDEEVCTDTAGDPLGPMLECEGGLTRAGSDLCWQDPPSDDECDWFEAAGYCNLLELGGHADWRLPTVGELRSIISGCSVTEAEGECGAGGPGIEGIGDDDCLGCDPLDGPGTCGCYRDESLSGSCLARWSATETPLNNRVWYVRFHTGAVINNWDLNPSHVRCVRKLPPLEDGGVDGGPDAGPDAAPDGGK